MSVTIYHNSRCSKSRAAHQYLEENSIDFNVVTYLDGTSIERVESLLKALNMSAKDVMRKGEKTYKELGLKDENDEAKLIAAIVANPILLERPIVVKDGKAAIARPIENVMALFD